jgi:hypothetical protein
LSTRYLKPSNKHTIREVAQGFASSEKTHCKVLSYKFQETPAFVSAFSLVFREAESFGRGMVPSSLAFSKGLVQHSLAHALAVSLVPMNRPVGVQCHPGVI